MPWILSSPLWATAQAVVEASPETAPLETVSSEIVSPETVAPELETALPGAAPRFDTGTETTHRRVTWDDFQAEVTRPAGRTRRGEGEQARISTAIQSKPFDLKVTLTHRGYWLAVPLEMTFYAVMDKQVSGVDGGARTDLLLAHEQGHFDLTEIAARRLLRGLSGVEGQGTTGSEARAAALGKIQRAYDRAVAELEERQARYDLETHHGQSARVQRDWNEDLARQLAAGGSGSVSAGSNDPP